MRGQDEALALHDIEIQLWVAERELERLPTGADPGLRVYWSDEIARLHRLAAERDPGDAANGR